MSSIYRLDTNRESHYIPFHRVVRVKEDFDYGYRMTIFLDNGHHIQTENREDGKRFVAAYTAWCDGGARDGTA